MRKYFILLACLAVVSCKQAQEECCPENPIQDSVAVAASADEPIEDSAVVKITETLEKSANIEESIKSIVETNVTLHTRNTKLVKELKTTKDSLDKVTFELKETKLKVPKKRNFFQRVLGVAKDSIEVKQIDTIQTK